MKERKERRKFAVWLITAVSEVLIHSMDQINSVNQHIELITFSQKKRISLSFNKVIKHLSYARDCARY